MEKMGRGGLEFSRDVLINPLSSLFSSPYQYLIINMKKKPLCFIHLLFSNPYFHIVTGGKRLGLFLIVTLGKIL